MDGNAGKGLDLDSSSVFGNGVIGNGVIGKGLDLDFSSDFFDGVGSGSCIFVVCTWMLISNFAWGVLAAGRGRLGFKRFQILRCARGRPIGAADTVQASRPTMSNEMRRIWKITVKGYLNNN